MNKTSTCQIVNCPELSTFEGKYNPRRINCTYVRHANTTAVIWPSGKVILLGCYPEQCMSEISSKYGVRHSNIVLKNVVDSYQLPNPVNLYGLRNVYFEPALFPGAKMKILHSTIVLFASGRYYMTGATNHAVAHQMFRARMCR